MDNLDYIDRYFKNELPPAEARQFGEKIESDQVFAEEVAFYLSALQVSRGQLEAAKKERFREMYLEGKVHKNSNPVRKWVTYMAAAALVAGIILGIYYFIKPVSGQQLADQYITDHFQTLGVQMSDRNDSVQTGLRLYNDGKTVEALRQFENIARADTADYKAKEYAGIVSLRLKEYDKALKYFEQLGAYPNLYANPALLYQSLTLLERNHPGDVAKARLLLQQVDRNDLEGRETARAWLKEW